MTARRRFSLVAAVVMFAAWVPRAQAWLRPIYQDAEVVARSELIVVGRLDKGSLKYVPHENKGSGGASWEYHGTLLVSEVLKGTLQEKQIPIVVNYGLDPLVGGRVIRENKNVGVGEPGAAIPPDRIDLIDTGNSAMSLEPILQDAQQDNLWCLRHLGGNLGREAGKGPLGIVDPEDVAAVKFKAYFQALLAKDTDQQLTGLLGNSDEAVVARSLRHLAAKHRPEDTGRIAKLQDAPSEEIQALAADALLRVADISAVPIFRAALGHAHPQVRAVACIGLCRFHDTASIPAIAKLLPDLPPQQRANVIAQLPRMGSRELVGPLLDQLDEHRDEKGSGWPIPYTVSAAAAEAVRQLTHVEFPLDSAAARRQWEALQAFPDEVLLRKCMLEDIDALAGGDNSPARSQAYETLGRLANQHLGSYNAFHSDDAASQELWRAWARLNTTKTRVDWIYAGFAQSGIVLARPMDAEGIDTLIAVLEFYSGPRARGSGATSRPAWTTDGGWVQARFHQENATWLLTRVTGYQVGQDAEASRWAAWWKDHRDSIKLLPLPEEKPVTAADLARVPSLRLASPPLSVIIRLKNPVHIFKGKEPLTLVVEVRNVSQQELEIEQHPYEVLYTYGDGRGSGGSGTRGGGSRGGLQRDDYVTLAPGQSITWDQVSTPDVDEQTSRPTVEALHYELFYPYSGSQFGLHAWRGKLYSNTVDCKIEDRP